jgi:AraC-like DNA-binding protein
MIDFRARLVGRFAFAQRTSWMVPSFCLSLNISGLRHFRCSGLELTGPQPFLSISLAGMLSEFEYGPERENWVVLGDTPHVRAGEAPGTMAIADDGDWIEAPRLVMLRNEQVPPWQEEFLRLRDAFNDPVPASRLRIRLGLAALLRPFLDQGKRSAASPAARLKRLIEDDPQCRESIARLSLRCGYHRDHLRELFVAAYGLTPVAYRARCRLSTAMGLIGGSGLGIGEIGRRVGFPHVSHFSSFFREAAGMSPREALKRYRHG